MNIGIITDQISQDLEQALQIISSKDYQYVEIHNVFGKSVEECSQEEAIKIKKLLDQYHLKCSNLSTTIFFLCPLYDGDEVSLFNDSFYSIKGNVDVHLKYLENACKVAKIVGCNKIRAFPFRFPDNRKGPYGGQEHQKEIIKNLKKAEKIVRENNCVLILENCPYSHCPKGEMTWNMVKELSSPYVQLLWDPANSYRAVKENVPKEYLKKNLLEELELIYPYISHIHIKDYHYDESIKDKPYLHEAIYDGDIDFDLLFQYLKDRNYDGVLSLEPEVSFDKTILCMDRLKKITTK